MLDWPRNHWLKTVQSLFLSYAAEVGKSRHKFWLSSVKVKETGKPVSVDAKMGGWEGGSECKLADVNRGPAYLMWKEAAICRGRCLVTRSDRVAGRLREAAGTGDESSTYTYTCTCSLTPTVQRTITLTRIGWKLTRLLNSLWVAVTRPQDSLTFTLPHCVCVQWK